MKKYLLLLFVLYLTQLRAQIVIHEENDDEQIVITDGDKTVRNNYKVGKNAWKVDVLGVLYGKYGASYERELLDFLSVEATLGATYINFSNYYLSFFTFDRSISLGRRSMGLREFMVGNVLNARPGYFVHLTPKIYFKNDGFEGPYINLFFNYSRWNYKERESKFTDFNAVNNSQLGGAIGFGYQTINGKMVLDFSTSLGVDQNNVNLFTREDKMQFNTAYTSFYYGISLKLGRYF